MGRKQQFSLQDMFTMVYTGWGAKQIVFQDSFSTQLDVAHHIYSKLGGQLLPFILFKMFTMGYITQRIQYLSKH